jgi:alpha-methylacyl-CoA racemase
VGPLQGLRIIEMAGLGAAPYTGMMLADLGAEVIRVERLPPPPPLPDVLARNRRSIALDLKQTVAVDVLLTLVDGADGLIEGFRPGVMERLGCGPERCLERNPALVYGRMTGWGQTGPLAGAAGHDLNYIALSGALQGIGESGGKPVPPLNLVGDFGGGLLLAYGMVCAFFERSRSGSGQVIDAAMLDAAASFMAMFCGFLRMGLFDEAPGASMLAGAAPFYDTYETADGRFVSVAAIEPEFYSTLLEKLGLRSDEHLAQGFRGLGPLPDTRGWPEMKDRMAEVFRTRTRDEWCELLEGTDACFAPVLGLSEAARHPHNAARETFTDVAGLTQNAPAPRFSRTPAAPPAPASVPGSDTAAVLQEAGLSAGEIRALAVAGAIVELPGRPAGAGPGTGEKDS